MQCTALSTRGRRENKTDEILSLMKREGKKSGWNRQMSKRILGNTY